MASQKVHAVVQLDTKLDLEKVVEVAQETNYSKCGQILNYITKAVMLILLLYCFVCSLGLLSDAFRLLGGRAVGHVLKESSLLSNPICGLMIGVLVTVLLQSSSTSSSIIVGLVASEILTVRMSIPIIMGANIGTSMTNTLVAMGHISDREEFRRAFAAATVHDMFNWCAVLILLPVEVATGFLYHLTEWIVGSMSLTESGSEPPELLNALTKPLTKMIVQLDKKLIGQIADGSINGTGDGFSLVKRQCGLNKCFHIFSSIIWSDTIIGAILLIIALTVLCLCLVFIVKLLHSVLQGALAKALKKFVNNDLPGNFACLTPYVAMLVGAVQSSSIVTSALTPLVGVGVLNLDRMYPLTLGANIGTTCTSVLAAMASEPASLRHALQIAFCHLFFNLSGVLIFFVIWPLRQVPLVLAQKLADKTAKHRWTALVYIVFMFFIIPLLTFGLSLITPYLLLIFVPFLLILLFVIVINILQDKRPTMLPEIVRNWNWLPSWLHSFKPYDRVFDAIKCCGKKEESELQEFNLTVKG